MKRKITLIGGTVGNIIQFLQLSGIVGDVKAEMSQTILAVIVAAVIQIGVVVYGEDK